MFSAKFRSSTAWMYPPTLTAGQARAIKRGFQENAHASAVQERTLTVFQVEVAGGLSGPEPHGVNNVVSVARHWGVVRKSQHHLDQSQTITEQMVDFVSTTCVLGSFLF